MMDEELVHDYDAAKRREYYLRNRHLKGRKKGAVKPPAKPHLTQEQRRKARQKKLEAQVADLKARMEKLQAVLKTLTEQAKKRSGVETKKKDSTKTNSQESSSKSDNKKSSKPEHKTAAQKAKEAAAQKKYRSKNEQLADEVKSLTGKLKTLQERIAKMRKTQAAKARANTK